MSLLIRDARDKDISSLVRIHRAALPNDLLPRLGTKYLESYYYPTVFKSKKTFTIVAEVDGEVRSFVTFTREGGKLTQELANDKLAIFRAVFRKFWKDPGLVSQIASVALGGRIKLNPDFKSIVDAAELYLIATDPKHQRAAIGERIVKFGLERIGQSQKYCLVKTSSDLAKKFYLRLGFQEIGKEFRGTRSMYLMMIEIKK